VRGLEERRGCGWKSAQAPSKGRPVWVRNGAVAMRCPKSVISGESAALVEAYWAWKLLGGMKLEEMEARQAHAFLILERETARLHGEK